MRIISGKYKIRTLPGPKGFTARPTTDFAKENLFNVLKNNYVLEDIKALDLFAGTGSISLELASNGCSSVLTVEKNPKHLAYIQSIIDRLNIAEIELMRGDALKFIQRTLLKFDLIFADPPYQMKGISAIPDIIFERGLLNQDGLFILEHSREYNFSDHPGYTQKKVYGSVNFSFFQPV
ncbi:RsmD family RNA methyltransferase [Saccharicrinis sp. FJH54]|uniref:RsmD family RNA methyltransferase n=1 Tax=Saccharicrinis sp. FJH54 TaxID=3344665 RepID=UPI0035D4C606